MSRKPYPTDLTEQEWELLQPLIPPPKTGGHPRTVDMREIVNAMSYVQYTGCRWRLLPHDLPPWSTVYSYFGVWRRSGVWKEINRVLQLQVRGRKGHSKTSSILDSKSVKTIEHIRQRISKLQKCIHLKLLNSGITCYHCLFYTTIQQKKSIKIDQYSKPDKFG